MARILLLIITFVPLLAAALWILREFFLGGLEIVTIIRLTKSKNVCTDAAVISVKKYLPYRFRRYYLIKYKFVAYGKDYLGSSFISRLLTDRSYLDNLRVLYMKNNPAINTIEENVSHGAVGERIMWPLLFIGVMAFSFARSRHYI